MLVGDRTHTANELEDIYIYRQLTDGEQLKGESAAGRIVARRAFGKLALPFFFFIDVET